MPRRTVFGGGASNKATLEIIPTSSFVVLYGSPSEAQPAELTGKLVLTNPESMPVRLIKVWLTGIRKVSWMTNTVTPQPVLSKKTFLNKEVPIFPTDGSRKQSHTIGAGVHEWPFRFEIPGDTDESVEGLISSYIIYELHASVDRGYMTKDLTAKRHIRIVRTLGQDVMESVPMEQINDDIWANKVAYRIVVPQKNYIVGTSIHADFTMIPLKKGVEIGKIKMEVIEHMLLYCEQSGHLSQYGKDTVVASMETDMPPNSERRVTPEIEALGTDHLFDESYHFNVALDLPKSLKVCRQSIDTENIKIIHKLRLYVNLHNPEGHTSQLLVKNHLHLFISPNLPPGEDQSVTVDHNVISAAAMQDEAMQTAPPTYGLHQLDELYHGIDPMGFQSNPVSAAHTPFYGLSRNPSFEHLQQLPTSLDAIADHDTAASASQLHSRLSNLRIDQDYGSGFSRSNRSSYYQSSGANTPYSGTEDSSASTHHSRQTSSDGYFPPTSNLNVVDYDMEELARIPSYNTAVRTPARTPISEDLPTYEVATSTPGSPVMRRSDSDLPSPTGSLATLREEDPLREETERNTRLNSRRASPNRVSAVVGHEGIRNSRMSGSMDDTPGPTVSARDRPHHQHVVWAADAPLTPSISASSSSSHSASSSSANSSSSSPTSFAKKRRFSLRMPSFGPGHGNGTRSGSSESHNVSSSVSEWATKVSEGHDGETTRMTDRSILE